MAIRLSTAALVGYAVFRQVMEVVILATRGLSGGFIIYLSSAIRDRSTKEYFPIYWAGTAWIALINFIGIALMLFCPNILINLFDNIDDGLRPDIIYLLVIGAAIMFVFILPRMAQIGFISLNKTGLLVLSSVVYVIVHIGGAYYWIEDHGVFGLAYAELAASASTLIVFLPLFLFYLKKEAKKQSSSEDIL